MRGAGIALLGVPLVAAAQRPSPQARIGFLTPGSNPREGAFWLGMRELGYVEGRNIVVERRSADRDFARLPALAEELIKTRPDVLVSIASAASIALQQATTTIPIVMVGVSDPIAAGLVGNFARPGGNVTGTFSHSNAAVGKLFELIRQVRHGATRVATLWNPTNAISQQLRLAEALSTAARLRVLVRIFEVRARDEMERAFAAIASERPDAMLVPGDTFFLAIAERVASLSIEHRLAAFSTTRYLTEAGMLASYGPDPAVFARRAAAYVQKILKGAKAGDLPVEIPTTFELVINERTAKAIGLVVPAAVLARADEVIR